MSYAKYSTTDRWRWVGGCVHEHVSVPDPAWIELILSILQWDSGEKIPTDKCYKLNTTITTVG
jgi:hypothetical protein